MDHWEVAPSVSGRKLVVLILGSEMWVMTPPHGTGYWGVSTQGSYMDHWEVAPSVSGRKLVVPTFGDGDAGGRI